MRFGVMKPGDDTGSLPLALLVITVGVMLTAMLGPVVVGQIATTAGQTRRDHALGAAEAGLDVALGQVRAAKDDNGRGRTGWLPCGPLTGSVSAGGTARYQVTIDYFSADPLGKPESWIAANRMNCTDTTGTAGTPTYALFRSMGTDSATGAFGSVPSRTLQATYPFQIDNRLSSGGPIHVFRNAGGNDLCLDAGSETPAAGTNVRLQLCNSNSPSQKFAYERNLTLSLVASKTVTTPLGMCLDAGSPHADNNLVQFRPCTATVMPRQQWSINDASNFEGTTDGSTLDGYCFNVQNPNMVGSQVILRRGGNNCHKAYNNVQSFLPEAAVGAGAAGAASAQLVNFNQFGRCLDVTDYRINSPYLIAWPCKQAPDPANVGWNQKWTLPAPGVAGKIFTDSNGGNGNGGSGGGNGLQCLKSPQSTSPHMYVTLANCPTGAPPDNMKWTVFGPTDRYDTSYRIVDAFGHCLTVTDPNATPPDVHTVGSLVSKIIVGTCSGSTAQKWNAVPGLLQAQPLTNVAER